MKWIVKAKAMCVQKRWAQKEKEIREQMKKLKSAPSTSEYSSFHGKYMLKAVDDLITNLAARQLNT